MELGLETLMMRYALLSGADFCVDSACFKSERDALKAVAECDDPEKVTAWPCPYCKGGNIVLPDGHESTLKGHGWHVKAKPSVKDLEDLVEMTVEECAKHGYPVSNKTLKERIEVYAEENIFEQQEPEDFADPKIRRAFRAAEQSYLLLKELLGCE